MTNAKDKEHPEPATPAESGGQGTPAAADEDSVAVSHQVRSETAPAYHTGTPEGTSPTAEGGTRSTIFLPWVTLILALGAGVAAAWVWQQQAGEQAATAGERAALNEQLSTLTARVGDQAEQLARGLERLHQAERGMKESLRTLHAEVGRSRRDWVLAEAEYFISVANQRLQLESDARTAVRALRIADRRLGELSDPALIRTRELLNKEIAALNALGEMDMEGLALTLGGLITRIDDLPLNQPSRGAAPAPATQEATPAGQQTWRDHVAGVWEVLRQLVQVRRQDAHSVPLLPPEQQFFLYENLRLELETARLALLRRDAATYAGSLKTAQEWLGKHFDTRAEPVKAMLTTLGRLSTADIAPQLPDISGSLKSLRLLLTRQQPADAGVGQ